MEIFKACIIYNDSIKIPSEYLIALITSIEKATGKQMNITHITGGNLIPPEFELIIQIGSIYKRASKKHYDRLKQAVSAGIPALYLNENDDTNYSKYFAQVIKLEDFQGENHINLYLRTNGPTCHPSKKNHVVAVQDEVSLMDMEAVKRVVTTLGLTEASTNPTPSEDVFVFPETKPSVTYSFVSSKRSDDDELLLLLT